MASNKDTSRSEQGQGQGQGADQRAPRRWVRRLRRGAEVFLVVLALAVVLWFTFIAGIVEGIVISKLADIGLSPASLRVIRVTPWQLDARSLVIGDNGQMNVADLHVTYSPGDLWSGRVDRVELTGVEWLIRYDGGKLDLGPLANLLTADDKPADDDAGAGLSHLVLRSSRVVLDLGGWRWVVPVEAIWKPEDGAGMAVEGMVVVAGLPIDVAFRVAEPGEDDNRAMHIVASLRDEPLFELQGSTGPGGTSLAGQWAHGEPDAGRGSRLSVGYNAPPQGVAAITANLTTRHDRLDIALLGQSLTLSNLAGDVNLGMTTSGHIGEATGRLAASSMRFGGIEMPSPSLVLMQRDDALTLTLNAGDADGEHLSLTLESSRELDAVDARVDAVVTPVPALLAWLPGSEYFTVTRAGVVTVAGQVMLKRDRANAGPWVGRMSQLEVTLASTDLTMLALPIEARGVTLAMDLQGELAEQGATVVAAKPIKLAWASFAVLPSAKIEEGAAVADAADAEAAPPIVAVAGSSLTIAQMDAIPLVSWRRDTGALSATAAITTELNATFTTDAMSAALPSVRLESHLAWKRGEAATLEGHIDLKNGSLAVAAFPTSLGGIEGQIPISWGGRRNDDQRAPIGTWRIADISVADQAVPAASGRISFHDARLEVESDDVAIGVAEAGAAVAADANVDANAVAAVGAGATQGVASSARITTRISLDLPTLTGQVRGSLLQLDIDNAKTLATLLPALDGLDIAGGFSFHFVGILDAGQLSPWLTLEGHDATFAAKAYDITASGIDAAVQFDRLSPLRTVPSQWVTVKKAEFGRLQLADGLVQFLMTSPKSILIERTQWRVGEQGHFWAHAFWFDPEAEKLEFQVFLEDMSIREWLALFTEDIEGQGMLYGRLALTLLPGERRPIQLQNGFLYARPGGGWIKYNDVAYVRKLLGSADQKSITGQVQQKAAEALTNFAYDWVRIDFTRENDDTTLTISTAGRGREGENPAPIGSLTVNLRGFGTFFNEVLLYKQALDAIQQKATEPR